MTESNDQGGRPSISRQSALEAGLLATVWIAVLTLGLFRDLHVVGAALLLGALLTGLLVLGTHSE